MDLNVETTRSNEERTIEFEGEDINLRLNFVWDTKHGYVNFNKCVEEQKSYKSAHVQIERYCFTETFHSLGITKDFEVWTVIVNGHRIPGDVVDTRGKIDANGKQHLTCKVVVGWG